MQLRSRHFFQNMQLNTDNSTAIEFFTITASIFHKEGLISQKDAENIRITLGDIQCGEVIRTHNVIGLLQQQNSEILVLLLLRYGASRLSSNLLRYCCQPSLAEMIRELSSWGNLFMPLIDQSFNRSFYIYENHECESRTLYSGVLLSIAEGIREACDGIWEALRLAGLFFPHAMASDESQECLLDEATAKALGFNGLCRDPFSSLSDKKMIRIIRQSLENLADCLEEFLIQTGESNRSLTFLSKTQVMMSCFRDQISGLRHTLIKGTDLQGADLHRQICLRKLYEITSFLPDIADSLLNLIREHQKDLFSSKTPSLGADVRRQISSGMVSGGVGPRHADQATKDLFEYMGKNTLKPQEILLGELNKINQALTSESLDILKEFCNRENLTKASMTEKKNILAKRQQLKSHFTKNLELIAEKSLILLLLFLPFGIGCGLKTTPKNTIEDLRPELPFIISSPPLPAVSETTERQDNGPTDRTMAPSGAGSPSGKGTEAAITKESK